MSTKGFLARRAKKALPVDRITKRRLCVMLFSLGIIAVALWSHSVRAQPFSPVMCTPCTSGWSAAATWKFDIENGVTQSDAPNFWDQFFYGLFPHYQKCTKSYRFITGNRYVEKVQVQHGALFLAPGDTLALHAKNCTGFCPGVLSGVTTTSFSTTHAVGLNNSLQADPLQILFATDDTQPTRGRGPVINGLKVCCNSNLANGDSVSSIGPGEQITGVLLGSGDVVYYRIPRIYITNAQTLGAGAGAGSDVRLNIALWAPDAPSDFDQDVYIRCGARPTPTAYDGYGYTNSHDEFVTWFDPNIGGCNQDLYIAVNSFAQAQNSAVAFELSVGYAYASKMKAVWGKYETTDEVRVGVHNGSLTAVQKADVKDRIMRGLKLWYGAVEGGNTFRGPLTLYTNVSNIWGPCGGGTCHFVVYVDHPTGDNNCCVHGGPDPWGSVVLAYSLSGQYPAFQPVQVAHEYGHRFSTHCGGPENKGCQHSIMSYYFNATNFCSSRDHGCPLETTGSSGLTATSRWEDFVPSHYPYANWAATPPIETYEGVSFQALSFYWTADQ
ncbi:MAG: hypothetical protein KAI47_08475 [Deltaproteobacteria bacterium]|nr:hypothetical protein [Deltaproteobacteria bacterium]